jgi:hypothetical protein
MRFRAIAERHYFSGAYVPLPAIGLLFFCLDPKTPPLAAPGEFQLIFKGGFATIGD